MAAHAIRIVQRVRVVIRVAIRGLVVAPSGCRGWDSRKRFSEKGHHPQRTMALSIWPASPTRTVSC